MAEGEGFEPPVHFHVRRFSRPVHSTALPPLRRDLKFGQSREMCVSNYFPYVQVPSAIFLKITLPRREGGLVNLSGTLFSKHPLSLSHNADLKLLFYVRLKSRKRMGLSPRHKYQSGLGPCGS